LYKQVYWHSLSFVVRFVVMLYSSCLSLYMMRSVIVNIDKRILLNEVCRITICWLNIIGLCNSTPHMRHFMATNFHKFDYHMVIYSAATLDFTTEHCETWLATSTLTCWPWNDELPTVRGTGAPGLCGSFSALDWRSTGCRFSTPDWGRPLSGSDPGQVVLRHVPTAQRLL